MKRDYISFEVGPFTYRLFVSEAEIYDGSGHPLIGLACEMGYRILLSSDLAPEDREEIAMHEYVHAWEFHVPPPRGPEQRCQFIAFIFKKFRLDLDAQGGTEAIRALTPIALPQIGRPADVWIPAAAAAKRISVRPPKVRKLIASGQLRGMKIGQRFRVQRDSLDRFIEDCAVRAEGGAA